MLPPDALRAMSRLRWVLPAVLALFLLGTDPALADCQVDPDGTGDPNLVVCRDLDPDGFDATGLENARVNVETDARIENGGLDDVPALAVGNQNTVNTAVDSEIEVSGAGAHGIEGPFLPVPGDPTMMNRAAGVTVIHRGSIVTDGTDSGGVVLGGIANVTNAGRGSIDVTGDGSVGIEVGDGIQAGALVITSTVRQNGSISATGDGAVGIRGGNVSIVTANAASSGTIDVSGGSNVGIDLGNSSTANSLSTMTVTGDDGTGIRIGNDGTIFNAAPITITGADGTGLEAGDAGSAISANQVANDSVLTIDGDGAVGMQMGERRLVVNRGSIDIQGADAVGVELGSGSRMIHSGSISITGVDAVGIRLGDATTPRASPPVEIESDATISIDGIGGIGVEVGAGADANNLGRIEVVGDGGIGVRLQDQGRLFNSGRVIGGAGAGAAVLAVDRGLVENATSGVIDGRASGVAILGGDGRDTVFNSGRIRGDVLLGDGDDVFRFFEGSSIEGALDGGAGVDNYQLGGESGGRTDLSTRTGFERLEIVDGGRWQISGSGTWTDGVRVSDGSFAPRKRVDLTGDYRQAAGSSFEVRLDEEGIGDRLDVTGAADIESSAELRIDLQGPVVESGSYTILTASDGLTGRFDEAALDEDLGDFVTVLTIYDADSLTVELIRQSYADAARNTNERRTGTNLDEILVSSPTGDMAEVLRTLDGLSRADTADALKQLNPEIYDAFSHASMLHGQIFADALRHHRPACEQYEYRVFDEDRKTQAPCGRYGLSPWATALGQVSDRAGSGGHSDYDVLGAGFAAGADYRFDDHLTASAGLAFVGSIVDFQGQGDGELYTLELGIQAAYERPWLRADAALLYGHGWHDADRDVDFLGRTANGDYDSDRLGLVATIGVPIPVGPVVIEPHFGMDYVYLVQEDFDESGADSINLEIDERTDSVFSTAAGLYLRAEWFNHVYWAEYMEWADGVWRPEAFVRFRTVWSGADRKIEGRFDGAPDGVGDYRVKADDDDNGAEFGARVSFQPIDSKMTMGLAYTGFVGKDTDAHRGTFEVRIPLP